MHIKWLNVFQVTAALIDKTKRKIEQVIVSAVQVLLALRKPFKEKNPIHFLCFLIQKKKKNEIKYQLIRPFIAKRVHFHG